jgi:hypothetical protein
MKLCRFTQHLLSMVSSETDVTAGVSLAEAVSYRAGRLAETVSYRRATGDSQLPGACSCRYRPWLRISC